ncbi:MAG: hypothetical protein JWQ35_2429 [Bacteriovoracaceae bacterium]|nr:hypothetical protein [Bacteriovoracaceae bacterium]
MKQKFFLKSNRVLKIFSRSVAFGICLCLLRIASATAQDGDTYANAKMPMGGYINFGLAGDLAMKGYQSGVVKRDPRLVYQLELGTQYFAIPISYSNNQSVQIYSVKPRLQYLAPIGNGAISAGPGVGFVYNYWYSDFKIAGAGISSHVHEIGAQGSFQIMLRPTPYFNILLTPAAFDFNLWRRVGVGEANRWRGNFSTGNSDLGIVYTGGASVGFNF